MNANNIIGGRVLHEKYKNIIFDVGAVLVYWNPEEVLRNAFGDEASDPSWYLSLFGHDLWSNFDRGISTKEQTINSMAESIGFERAVKLFEAGINCLSPLREGVAIFNEIKQLGYKTYILSNMSELALQKIAVENDFVNRVDGAIWSYKVKSVKPEPAIYNALLNQYSLKAGECLFIDDREDNIKAATSLGIDGIVCKNHEYVRQELVRLNILG